MMLQGMLPRLVGFIIIVITLALAPSIYTANLTVVNYASGSGGLTNFIGMDAISPFGGFLIILGILVAQGIFAIGQFKSGKGQGWGGLAVMVGSVVGVIILLNLYSAAVLPAFDDLIDAASTAGDNIGQTAFGVLPIVVYLGIVMTAVGIQGYKAARSGGRRGSRRAAVAYA